VSEGGGEGGREGVTLTFAIQYNKGFNGGLRVFRKFSLMYVDM